MLKKATFSPCRTWRYSLLRTWNDLLPHVVFIGLNPSTADETQDDPTIRRCIGFAKSWGYGSLVMLNIFAYRSTDPKGLLAVDDPIGPENDKFIKHHALAAKVICAWGVHGDFRNRAEEAKDLILSGWHLGLTKGGHPKHPLYLRGDTKPQIWFMR